VDDDALSILVATIQKKYGKNALFRAGEVDLSVERVLTDLTDLDNAIIGIPKGRLIEVYGSYSSGKTSLAYHFMSKFPYSLFVDAEGTFDIDYARRFGVREEKTIVQLPEWGEQAFEVIFAAAEAGVPLIVVDSVPALVPRKEYDEKDFEKSGKVGGLANLLSRKLPKLVHICAESGTTVLFINQVRAKIGVLFGDPLDTPGGFALKHYCSMRLKLTRKSWINHPKLGTYGQISVVHVAKSKVSKPKETRELVLLFDCGYVNQDEVASRRKELLKNPPTRPTFAEDDNEGEDDE